MYSIYPYMCMCVLRAVHNKYLLNSMLILVKETSPNYKRAKIIGMKTEGPILDLNKEKESLELENLGS